MSILPSNKQCIFENLTVAALQSNIRNSVPVSTALTQVLAAFTVVSIKDKPHPNKLSHISLDLYHVQVSVGLQLTKTYTYFMVVSITVVF